MSRPPITEIQSVHVVDYNAEHDQPFVEVFMERGDKCEALTAEFFPYGRPEGKDEDWHDSLVDAPTDRPCVRLLQRDIINEKERIRYKRFASIVGRLTYHEP